MSANSYQVVMSSFNVSFGFVVCLSNESYPLMEGCEGPSWSCTRTRMVSKRYSFYLPKENNIRAVGTAVTRAMMITMNPTLQLGTHALC